MLRINKKFERWLPVVIWLEFIFILSSIPGGMIPLMPSDWMLFWAHRIAHFGEYSVLGVLLLRAYGYGRGKLGLGHIIFLSIIIFLAGSFDEWHQSFVPGRSPQLIDAMFDSICGTFGLLVYKLFVLDKQRS